MSADLRLAGAANRLLSPAVVREVIDPSLDGQAAASTIALLADLGMVDGARTVRTLTWRCYRWLSRNYRNDHIYRNAVMDQMAPSEGPVLILQEAKVNRSIVDYLLVGNAVHAVEIKSDLDNLARLAGQLIDYRQVAPLVSVLGSSRTVQRIESDVRFQHVGLSWLDADGVVQVLRNATHESGFLESVTMMRSLRRSEYLSILEILAGPVPAMPNTKIFTYARNATEGIDPVAYHEMYASTLGLRRTRLSPWALSRVPSPLKPTVLKLNPTRDGLVRLRGWLDLEVADVLA